MSFQINVSLNTANTENYVSTALGMGVFSVNSNISEFTNSGRVYGGGGAGITGGSGNNGANALRVNTGVVLITLENTGVLNGGGGAGAGSGGSRGGNGGAGGGGGGGRGANSANGQSGDAGGAGGRVVPTDSFVNGGVGVLEVQEH